VAAVGVLIALASPGVAQTAPAVATMPGLDRFVPAPLHGLEDGALVVLGRRLFFDPVLSADSSLSCASCHQPSRSFADGRTVSVGVFGRRGTRNVPSIVNRGWGKAFFWDGRIRSLEEQVVRPIVEPMEMGMTLDQAVARLGKHPAWRTRFRDVLGHDVSEAGVARALAAYVRSIRAGESRFDRAMLGDAGALTAPEQRGLELFQGRARCARCHSGALLTDELFHNTGVAWRTGEPADSGRALVTQRASDIGAFKTPTLRQVGLTSPYMHDGSLRTLGEVIDFYDRGGHPNPGLDRELHPLGLSASEKAALLAFLGTLDGRIAEGGSTSIGTSRP
jgi:cytochrome c peroxidase